MDGNGTVALEGLRRALAEIEPTSLPGGAVAELVSQLGAVVAAAQAALVRAVGAAELTDAWGRAGLGVPGTKRAEHPWGSVGAVGPAGSAGVNGQTGSVGWVAGRAHLTVGAAAALLFAARALRSLPVLAEAFRRGEVSLDHVLALTAPLTSPPRLAALAGPAEAELTELARRAGPAQVRAAVTRWLRDADPVGAGRDAAAAWDARSLSLVPEPPGCAEAHPGGRVTIAGSVPIEDAGTLLAALRLAAQAAAAAGPVDARVPAQRRADALLTVARCYLAAVGHLTTAGRSEPPPPCSDTGSAVRSADGCSSRCSASRRC